MTRLSMFASVFFALIICAFSNSQAEAQTTINVACDTAALVGAVTTANSTPAHDTLNLAAGCDYTFSTASDVSAGLGPSALPRITTPITIEGNGATLQRQSDTSNFRLIYNSNTGILTLKNVTINGGRSDTYGGGIYNAGGILTVANSTFSANDANSMGGGIYSITGSTLTVSNSVFSGNSTDSYGGAIRSDGVMTVTGTIFTGNTAVGTTTGGGAISSTGTATISSSTFSGNSSKQSGGAITSAIGTTTITDSVFSDNHAALSGGGSGGGINNSIGTTTVIDSTITGNSAIAGGGISTGAGGTLIVTGSTITGNSAINRGGGITTSTGTLTVTSSTITGNRTTAESTGLGGGIYNGSTPATVINSTLSGNHASGSGGGIYSEGTLTVTNSTLASNNAAVSGGGVHGGSAALTVTNSIVWGNSSQITGQPATVTYSIVLGGYAGTGNSSENPAFVAPVSYTLAPTTSGDFHITMGSAALNKGSNAALPNDAFDVDGDSDLLEPLPLDRDGEARVMNSTVDMGADEFDYCLIDTSLYTVTSTAVLIRAIECANANPDANVINLASGNYSFGAAAVTTAYGGVALPIITSPITINGNGAIISRHPAAVDFRLLYIESGGNLTLNTIKVQNGKASHAGGILNRGGTLTLVKCTVSGNIARTNQGGGIASRDGIVTIIDSIIQANSARDGGGIDSSNDTLTIVSSTIAGNSAVDFGGGLSVLANNATLTNSTIIGNDAGFEGGGIFNSGPLTIVNSTIASNKADSSDNIAGGIASVGPLTIANSIIWGNSRQISGSATITYSIVQGGYTGIGNVNVNPLFVAPLSYTVAPASGGDYHLQTNSPALNKGSNAALPADAFDVDGDSDVLEPLPLDRDGEARILNATVDMGAYEHQLAAAIVLSKITTAATEGSTTDTYTIRLASRPSASVTIDLSTGGQASVSPDPLTFTTSNWSTNRTVTVTAVNDAVAEGEHSDTVTHSATSTDLAYNGITVAEVAVAITDNDTASIQVSVASVSVTEGGSSGNYTVVLNSEPTASVIVTPTGDSQCTVSAALVFTSADWDTPQSLTVTAVDDSLVEGLHSCVVTHAATSGDPNYNGAIIAPVSGTVTDNDTTGVNVAPTTIHITEGGTTAFFAVSLASQPTSDVTVTPTGDENCSVSAALVFTNENWMIAQDITVTAVNDSIAEGTHSCVITHAAASGDPNYNGATIASVSGTVTDNDTTDVIVAPTTVHITEGGAPATFAVSLTSQPTSDVVITPTGDENCSVSAALVFTSENWMIAQDITVTAVNDSIAEGTHSCVITHAATSSDPNYNGATIAPVSGTVTDNDTTGVIVAPTTIHMTEGGAPATFAVSLASQPTSDVIVTPTGDEQCAVGNAITFDSLNWDTAQFVTVMAVDDTVAEGNHACTVTNSVFSAGTSYNGISVASVNGSILDDDPFPSDLITNGSFELHTSSNKIPDGWSVRNVTADKLLCKPGKARTGLCAFRFAGGVGEKGQLYQMVDLTAVTVDAGDALTLSAFFKGNNTTANTQMRLIVTYTGNPTPLLSKITVKRNATYALVSLPVMDITATVEKIKVMFKHKSASGKVLIDDVSLMHASAGGRNTDVLPASGTEGFRSNN